MLQILILIMKKIFLVILTIFINLSLFAQTQYDYYDVNLIGETDEYWMFERNRGAVDGKEKQYS